MSVELIFIPVDDCRSRSACGRYEVTKQGPRFARSWLAWYMPRPDRGGLLIEAFRQGNDDQMRRAAKEACRRHANEHRAAARPQENERE